MTTTRYPSSQQQDAHTAATTALDAIAAIRNDAARNVAAELVAGHPIAAQAKLKMAVERQAGLAGCGRVELPMAQDHYRVGTYAEATAQNLWAVIARRNDIPERDS